MTWKATFQGKTVAGSLITAKWDTTPTDLRRAIAMIENASIPTIQEHVFIVSARWKKEIDEAGGLNEWFDRKMNRG